MTYFFLLSQISSVCLYFCWDRPYRCTDLGWIPLRVRAPLWTGSLSVGTRPMLGLTLGTKEKTSSQPHLGQATRKGYKPASLVGLLCVHSETGHITWTWVQRETLTMTTQVLSFWSSLSGSRAGEILRLERALHRSIRPTHSSPKSSESYHSLFILIISRKGPQVFLAVINLRS